MRACNFSYSGNMAAYATDKAMKQPCEIFIIDVRNPDESIEGAEPILRIPVNGARVSALLWGTLDEVLLTGHESGEIVHWDLKVSIAEITIFFLFLFCLTDRETVAEYKRAHRTYQ